MRKIHLASFPEYSGVKKASLIGVYDGRICDGCDESNKRCASICTIGGEVSVLCVDCIEGILEALDPSSLRDRKITKLGI